MAAPVVKRTLVCPACGRAWHVDFGASACPHCGVRGEPKCGCGCGESLDAQRGDSVYRSEAHAKAHQRAGRPDVYPTTAGVGTRGGNVRSVEEARSLQDQQREKQRWADAIDEQIARTLIGTGYFHADDLDPLEVPSAHCNLKGTRTAWFRNHRLMESTDVLRKVAHVAANGRKAPIYRITAKGRDELAQVKGDPIAGVSVRGGAAEVAGSQLGADSGDSATQVGVGNGEGSAPEPTCGAPSTGQPCSGGIESTGAPSSTDADLGESDRLFTPPARSAITDSEAA